jgi:hypothetical protein
MAMQISSSLRQLMCIRSALPGGSLSKINRRGTRRLHAAAAERPTAEPFGRRVRFKIDAT